MLALVATLLAGSSLWYANTERSRVRDQADAVKTGRWYVVTIASGTGDLLRPTAITDVCRLSGVAWAISLTAADDAVIGPTGRTVTVRGATGCGLRDAGVPTDGSRIHSPVGFVHTFPLGDLSSVLRRGTAAHGAIGSFQLFAAPSLPSNVLGGTDRQGLIILPRVGRSAGGPAALRIRLGTTSLDSAEQLARTVAAVVAGPDDAAGLEITPTRDQFRAERRYLAGLDRSSAAAVIGLILAAALVASGALLIASRLRAREYARRRTLGCRRLPLVALVMSEAMLCVGIGSVVGAGAVALLLQVQGNLALSTAMVLAVPAVSVGSTGCLSAPVAVWVGFIDPIVVLRMP
jgi:hypothetical protein